MGTMDTVKHVTTYCGTVYRFSSHASQPRAEALKMAHEAKCAKCHSTEMYKIKTRILNDMRQRGTKR